MGLGEGLLGVAEVSEDRRVRFWIVLPSYLGAAALLLGLFLALPMIGGIAWEWGYALPAEVAPALSPALTCGAPCGSPPPPPVVSCRSAPSRPARGPHASNRT